MKETLHFVKASTRYKREHKSDYGKERIEILYEDNMIQVVSGIYEGEKVVVEGMTSVSDGSKVRNISSGLNAE